MTGKKGSKIAQSCSLVQELLVDDKFASDEHLTNFKDAEIHSASEVLAFERISMLFFGKTHILMVFSSYESELWKKVGIRLKFFVKYFLVIPDKEIYASR